jgi:hypothetical protein
MTASHTSQNQHVFKGQRGTQKMFVMFGLLFCFFAVILQFLAYPDWASRVAAFVFLTLPIGGFGAYFLHAGWLLRQARVVVSEAGVTLNIPTWKAGWLFRGARVALRWEEIYEVQHERQAMMAGGKAIDYYWFHRAQGSFLLTPNLCREVAEVVRLIAERKGWKIPTPPQLAKSSRVIPEKEEVSLKRKAIAAVVILVSLLFGIILAVTSETAVGQMLHQGLWWLSQFFNLFAIVVTAASIFSLWWKARHERLRRKQNRLAEKIYIAFKKKKTTGNTGRTG